MKSLKFKRRLLYTVVTIGMLAVAGRLALPSVIRWYVNRTLDQSPLYQGQIGTLRVHLWRGAYSIEDVRMLKRTGNTSEPFFSAKRMDLALQWNALRHGRLVGRIILQQPAVHFISAKTDADSQSGEGGPWLEMVRELFPFKINRLLIHNGSIHFHAPDHATPVDVHLDQVEATLENLTNVSDDLTPLPASIDAQAKVMGQAAVQLRMKFDPFSYRPTFELAVQLLGLDVTKLNDMARAYGGFDFKAGWFDLVIELTSKEGQLDGYVKPLFREIQIFDPRQEFANHNAMEIVWEALVGAAASLLKNQPHDQFGTLIPFHGSLMNPRTDWLAAIGNILRNAFIRAYLPKFQGVASDVVQVDFGQPKPFTKERSEHANQTK